MADVLSNSFNYKCGDMKITAYSLSPFADLVTEFGDKFAKLHDVKVMVFVSGF